jgi:hypothetical protein
MTTQGHYHYESDEYCGPCLGAFIKYAELDQGSQDCPAHCCECHQLLDCTLTDDGVNYVIEYLTDALAKGSATDVEKQWAGLLGNYGLDGEQKQVLEQFTDKFGAIAV